VTAFATQLSLLGSSLKASGVARCPANLDLHIVAVSPARLLQPLDKGHDARLSLWIVCGQIHEHADAPHRLALSVRDQRPADRRAAEQRDELAPFHLTEMHPIPHGPERTGRIADCSGSVSGPRAIGEPQGSLGRVSMPVIPPALRRMASAA
jgi:hypothetical protein